ncbi:MAG: (2Fe-2S)-binding protein [Proteobacteria bacterium]|nr:(2Fe-2S)-binding protein [Pseudomonadota bacterium]
MSKSSATAPDTPQDTAPDELICACTGLRLDAFRAELDSNPSLSFDDILKKTGAGGSCTACLLDLEYFYVSMPRNNAQASGTGTTSKTSDCSFKRKLFDFIDDCSPLVPYELKERLPVISGAGMEQHLWVSNRSLMFEGNRSAPPFKVSLKVRNAAGEIRHREKRTVEPESALDLPMSHFIDQPTGSDGALSVGSVEIRRRGTHPGFRGTTRTQTEILARDGACSVHAQGYKLPGDRWFSFAHQPQDQRVFISFINFANSHNQIALSYPMNATDLGIEPRRFDFNVPPNGAVIHEVVVTQAEADAIKGRQVALKWNCSDEYNSHIFCATPDLGRISIDHS